MLCVLFVLNFLSATDPPSTRQKAARQNGGPVGKSNLEAFWQTVLAHCLWTCGRISDAEGRTDAACGEMRGRARARGATEASEVASGRRRGGEQAGERLQEQEQQRSASESEQDRCRLRADRRARGAGRERWQFKFGSRERAPSERADALAKLNRLAG